MTHVCQGQLAVHWLAILLGRNEAGISNRGKVFCTTLYGSRGSCTISSPMVRVISAAHDSLLIDFIRNNQRIRILLSLSFDSFA